MPPTWLTRERMVSIPLGEGVAVPVWVLGLLSAMLTLAPGDSFFFFPFLGAECCDLPYFSLLAVGTT